MHINVGKDLFLPEGDDYSKTEFDKTAETLASEGQARLHELRKNQILAKKPGDMKPINATNSINKNEKEENKKMSYKEIFEKIAATK